MVEKLPPFRLRCCSNATKSPTHPSIHLGFVKKSQPKPALIEGLRRSFVMAALRSLSRFETEFCEKLQLKPSSLAPGSQPRFLLYNVMTQKIG
ncbi:hypothetical protein [Rhizobium rosettiformans]|uniref:hypothetical protein n=1 Tax=Rhizobium rosettiformans TaxID=1368430 RepID=UPI0028607871|nr:hypothetical protein [Rhizobium rosettiformans]MDR7026929.1 hypothetical protein [Rhizobium rosettiformans]MDR7065050.1 hypothetical protein [Rhizobium rosettiformans]